MPLTAVTEAVAGTIPVIVTAGIAHRAARGLGGTRRRRVVTRRPVRKLKPIKRAAPKKKRVVARKRRVIRRRK